MPSRAAVAIWDTYERKSLVHHVLLAGAVALVVTSLALDYAVDHELKWQRVVLFLGWLVPALYWWSGKRWPAYILPAYLIMALMALVAGEYTLLQALLVAPATVCIGLYAAIVWWMEQVYCYTPQSWQ